MIDFMADHPSFTLTMIGIGLAVRYLIVCAWWPFARCLFCRGVGRKYQNEKRKTWRRCRWCKSTGQRRRVGRTVWAYFAESRRRAK